MATRSRRTDSGSREISDGSFYLGIPKNFTALPTWEKILILASTYKPAERVAGLETQGDSS